MQSRGLFLLLVLGGCWSATATVFHLGPLIPYGFDSQPPVTNWLLSNNPAVIPASDRLAWRKIGSKVWTLLSNYDFNSVDINGQTVPPPLANQLVRGAAARCGRLARLFIRIPFHDCGTFDVGNTGSVGDTGRPRFGCNGSLRFEVAPCNAGAPLCFDGVEAAVDVVNGGYLPENAFAALEAKYGAERVKWSQDPVHPRIENTGFANALAFFYQIKLETELDEPPATSLAHVSLADIIMYAGMLAIAKCGGPHIEFQPGRVDSDVADAPERLPAPTEPLSHTISYFWTNGLTNFDMANLLAAHTSACFNVGCLDATPTRFDSDWASQLLSVTGPTDPRICNFSPPPALPPPPVPMCFLPADVELAARQDVRNYLLVMTGQMSIAAAANVHLPCFYQPGVPEVHGACDVGPGVGADFQPFTLVRTLEGNVNLCSRTTPFVDRTTCPIGPDVLPEFQDATATSFFKMSQMYVDASGATPGAAYGVQRQPCTPGLIQIGTPLGVPPPNPLCLCCPAPAAQTFSLGLELLTCPPAAAANRRSIRGAGPRGRCFWDRLFGTSFM